MADIARAERSRASRARVPGHAATTTPASAAGVPGGFLAQVLGMLSHHERMALRLRHGEGLDAVAIAARMNLPEAIVRDLIRRGELTIRAAQQAFIEALAEQAPASAPAH